MSTLAAEAVASRAWCDDHYLWVAFADGRKLAVPLGFFPRLMHATGAQRDRLQMGGGGTGLHWDAIDEDISVPGLLSGGGDNTRLGREHHATCPVCRASIGAEG
jgi:hypothetical protein